MGASPVAVILRHINQLLGLPLSIIPCRRRWIGVLEKAGAIWCNQEGADVCPPSLHARSTLHSPNRIRGARETQATSRGTDRRCPNRDPSSRRLLKRRDVDRQFLQVEIANTTPTRPVVGQRGVSNSIEPEPNDVGEGSECCDDVGRVNGTGFQKPLLRDESQAPRHAPHTPEINVKC